mgnify:CR=1 FL=1
MIDTDNRIQSFAANRTISVARSAITTVNLGVNALKSVSTLKPGALFNETIKTLANGKQISAGKADTRIKILRFVTNSAETSETIVSDETAAIPAYAVWNAEAREMVIYTAADKVMAHANSSDTFLYMQALTSLDLKTFDTANATSMNQMFRECYSLPSLDVSTFNTEKVTDMNNMFNYCMGLRSLDVSGFNTANVTNMSGMFAWCWRITSLDLKSFNTEKVTDMNFMFLKCEGLPKLDVSTFNTANVTNMDSMFDYCESLTSLDLSMFNTEKVKNMYFMFGDCYNLTSLNLGTSFTMDLVSNTDEMCYNMASVSGACTVSCTEETENKMKASRGFPTSGISFVRPQ